MDKGLGDLVVGKAARHVTDELFGRSHTIGRHILERERLGIAERPNRQPPQGPQMGAAAQPRAEIGREHTYVGAR